MTEEQSKQPIHPKMMELEKKHPGIYALMLALRPLNDAEKDEYVILSGYDKEGRFVAWTVSRHYITLPPEGLKC